LHLALAKDILKSVLDDAPDTEQSVCNGENIYDKVTFRWTISFQERFDIVLCHQTGRLAVSKDQQELIEKSVAYHLGDVVVDSSQTNWTTKTEKLFEGDSFPPDRLRN
jgi:hypothetical protein